MVIIHQLLLSEFSIYPLIKYLQQIGFIQREKLVLSLGLELGLEYGTHKIRLLPSDKNRERWGSIFLGYISETYFSGP